MGRKLATNVVNQTVPVEEKGSEMRTVVLAVVAVNIMTAGAKAETNTAVVTRLPEVEVVGTAPPPTPWTLPPVEGAKIYDSKKTTVVELEKQPPVVNQNHRQAAAQVPGLLISESSGPTHLNQNYRGIGDPHESEFVLTLKDGVPIVSDWFGYSTVYFAPPLEAIQRVEFVRGGGALLYGPQPGPVLNYVTKDPPADTAFRLSSQNVFGSDALYGGFHWAGGTVDQLGYLAAYSRLQGDGPRRNADYESDWGLLKMVWHADDATRWWFTFDGGSKEVGEPGRLSLAQYRANRNFTPTPFDRLFVDRYMPVVGLERQLSEDSLLTWKAWGGYQDRLSRRQINALTNNLDRQEFYFGGVEVRLRHDWDWDGERQILTVGAVGYGADSPRYRERGTPLTATRGTRVFELERHTAYGALFAENLFRAGRLTVTPSVRLDIFEVAARENFNTTVTRALIDESEFHVVPLGGLGATWQLTPRNQLYGSVSTTYRPLRYDDLVNPTSNTQLAPSDLEPSLTWQVELGVRGSPTGFWSYDTSLFFIHYDDVIENRVLGGGNVERANSGAARYLGWEAASELDLMRWWDEELARRYGSVSVFGSVSLLTAEFVKGANDGRRPAYAPDYIIKTGVKYMHPQRAKLALTGTLVADSFWQDNNQAGTVGTATIPAYGVWDLTGEWTLWRDNVTVLAGINNLFDEDYYSRVRSDGIEPALRRTFFVGFRGQWP